MEYRSKQNTWYCDQDFLPKSSKPSKLRIQELQRVTTLGEKNPKPHNITYFSYAVSVFIKWNDFCMEVIS